MQTQTTPRLHLVAGLLEYVQGVVQKSRAEYERIKHRMPVGLLDELNATFELDAHPTRLSRGPAIRYTPSSSTAEIGTLVHKQLELAAAGEVIVSPHAFTQAIANFIMRKGWTVIAAEVPVVCEDINLATRIDLLLYDVKTNDILLTEIKTGKDSGYRARLVSKRAHLGIPKFDVFDSQHTRTHLQLAWMYWALKKQYGVPNLLPIVIVANARGVKSEKLARWARVNCQIVYDRVAQHRRLVRTNTATQPGSSSITSTSRHN